MKRTALALELLALLAPACERQDKGPAPGNEDNLPVESADPEWQNGELERELDRIEQEIADGKQRADAPRATPDHAAPPEPEKPARTSRNRARKVRDRGRTHGPSSGNGSS